MNVNSFLAAVKAQNISTLVWVWKQDSTDQDALRTQLGTPNNNNNNNWGSTFKTFLK